MIYVYVLVYNVRNIVRKMCVRESGNISEKYKLVPPDGGWGYMITIAVILNISTSTMFISSWTLLFKEFLLEIGRSSKNVILESVVSSMCVAIAGYLTSCLLSVMSMRMLALAATLIFNAGVICIMFVNSVFMFYICQGILQGIGIGIIYNLSCTILMDYFVKRRLMVISFVQSIVAISALAAPLVLKSSLHAYGFHATIMLMSGLAFHNLIGVALMQPVKWHMRRIETADGSTEKILHDKKPSEEGGMIPNVKFSEKPENNKDLFEKIINTVIDRSLIKTFLMSCVCIGPALTTCVDDIYKDILPKALFLTGWKQEYTALAMSLYGFGDLAMRVLLVLLSHWLQKLGSQEIYLLGVTLGLLSRLGMLWSKSPIAIMVYIALVGASHAAVSILIPLVVADAVHPEKFSSALGSVMLITGIFNLVLRPTFGAVRELTDSYGAPFYLIASCFAIILMFWSIEMCYKRNKHKRLQRIEYLRQKKLNK